MVELATGWIDIEAKLDSIVQLNSKLLIKKAGTFRLKRHRIRFEWNYFIALLLRIENVHFDTIAIAIQIIDKRFFSNNKTSRKEQNIRKNAAHSRENAVVLASYIFTVFLFAMMQECVILYWMWRVCLCVFHMLLFSSICEQNTEQGRLSLYSHRSFVYSIVCSYK